MRLNDKGTLNSYRTTAKTHSAMQEKNDIPLHAEHLHFLIKHCNCIVMKIYFHYIFGQNKSKKDFVIMNQESRQNLKTNVEKDL